MKKKCLWFHSESVIYLCDLSVCPRPTATSRAWVIKMKQFRLPPTFASGLKGYPAVGSEDLRLVYSESKAGVAVLRVLSVPVERNTVQSCDLRTGNNT